MIPYAHRVHISKNQDRRKKSKESFEFSRCYIQLILLGNYIINLCIIVYIFVCVKFIIINIHVR